MGKKIGKLKMEIGLADGEKGEKTEMPVNRASCMYDEIPCMYDTIPCTYDSIPCMYCGNWWD